MSGDNQFTTNWSAWRRQIDATTKVDENLENALLSTLSRQDRAELSRFDRRGQGVAVTLPFLRHPVRLRPGTSDVEVLWDVFARDTYRIPFRTPRGPSVIVDAGANIGITSIYFSSLYPRARVIAIEPEPSNL